MGSLKGSISGTQTLNGGSAINIAVTPDIKVGTVTTLEPNTSVVVELDETSTRMNPILNFGIPKGEKGEKGDAGSVKFIIANELPTEDIDESAIYMIPAGMTEEGNTYAEYIYVNGTWESLGSASVNVDMKDYVKNTDYAGYITPTDIRYEGLINIPKEYGLGFQYNTKYLILRNPPESYIDKRDTDWHADYYAITVRKIDYAVMKALSDSKLEWTEEEKASARELLGVNTGGASLEETVLYENLDGSSEDITLSDNAENYKYIEIYFRNEQNHYNFTRVYQPHGKSVCLMSNTQNNDGEYRGVYFRNKMVFIDGVNIKTINSNQVWVTGNTQCGMTVSSPTTTFITRVVGYK